MKNICYLKVSNMFAFQASLLQHTVWELATFIGLPTIAWQAAGEILGIEPACQEDAQARSHSPCPLGGSFGDGGTNSTIQIPANNLEMASYLKNFPLASRQQRGRPVSLYIWILHPYTWRRPLWNLKTCTFLHKQKDDRTTALIGLKKQQPRFLQRACSHLWWGPSGMLAHLVRCEIRRLLPMKIICPVALGRKGRFIFLVVRQGCSVP